MKIVHRYTESRRGIHLVCYNKLYTHSSTCVISWWQERGKEEVPKRGIRGVLTLLCYICTFYYNILCIKFIQQDGKEKWQSRRWQKNSNNKGKFFPILKKEKKFPQVNFMKFSFSSLSQLHVKHIAI